MRSHRLRSVVYTQSNSISGLTLIELLVVIVVAGILAAISLPSLLSRANAAKQVEAKSFVSSLNRAQLAYYTEHGEFTDQIENLALKIQNSGHYNYKIQASDGSSYVEHHAQPKQPTLRAYVGMTALIRFAVSEVTAQSILCESDDPMPQAPSPKYKPEALECGDGSRGLN